MRKIISYTLITFSILTISFVGLLFYAQFKTMRTYDTSQLSLVSYKGQNYKTTGAIPTQDEKQQELMNQTIRLATATNTETSQFLISVSQYGDINVKLYKPFKVNKQKFFAWLDNNGYDKIDKTKITFEESN